MRVAHSASWQGTGVFFDNVAIRLADADGNPGPQSAYDATPFGGLGTPARNCSAEEFTFAAPIPGCCGDGHLRDGKASPMIVYKLFLDSHEHLN